MTHHLNHLCNVIEVFCAYSILCLMPTQIELFQLDIYLNAKILNQPWDQLQPVVTPSYEI